MSIVYNNYTVFLKYHLQIVFNIVIHYPPRCTKNTIMTKNVNSCRRSIENLH